MRGNEIQLNFFPLTTQEFQFTVWRKPYAGEKKEGPFENLYRKTLPLVPDSLDERGDYWISFEERKDLDKFVCEEDYNHILTQDFLHYLLCLRIRDALQPEEYFIPTRDFGKHIGEEVWDQAVNMVSAAESLNHAPSPPSVALAGALELFAGTLPNPFLPPKGAKKLLEDASVT